MTEKKKILFIVNPISGKGQAGKIAGIVDRYLDKELFDSSVEFTRYAGHGAEIVACSNDTDIFVAVGGDGTVNEIASVLVGTDKILAIIPMGSGNGLAFHLGISRDPVKAIHKINGLDIARIDTATINGKAFFCTSGVGFDAKVAYLYSKDKNRGLVTYAKKTFEALGNNQVERYCIETDENKLTMPSFLVACGNANQWGNNFYITPSASVTDGILNITIIKNPNIFQDLTLALKLLNGKIGNCSCVRTYKASHVRIYKESGDAMYAHYDGEPLPNVKEVDIKIVPQSLSVIC